MNKTTLAGLALVALLGGVGIWYALPEAAPEPVGHSMVPPDTSAVEAGGPIAEVVIPAAFSANAQIGQRVFEASCAFCHGVNAAGQNGVAPPLVHRIYEPSHHSDAAFVNAARNGVRSHHWEFGNMPPVPGLNDAEIGYIARYIRELQLENGIR